MNLGDIFTYAANKALDGDKALLGALISESRVSETARKALELYQELPSMSIKDREVAKSAISEGIASIDKTEYSAFIARLGKKYLSEGEELEATPLNESIHNAICGSPIKRGVAMDAIIESCVSKPDALTESVDLDKHGLNPEQRSFLLEYATSEDKGKLYMEQLKEAIRNISEDVRALGSDSIADALVMLSESDSSDSSVFKLYEFNNDLD